MHLRALKVSRQHDESIAAASAESDAQMERRMRRRAVQLNRPQIEGMVRNIKAIRDGGAPANQRVRDARDVALAPLEKKLNEYQQVEAKHADRIYRKEQTRIADKHHEEMEAALQELEFEGLEEVSRRGWRRSQRSLHPSSALHRTSPLRTSPLRTSAAPLQDLTDKMEWLTRHARAAAQSDERKELREKYKMRYGRKYQRIGAMVCCGSVASPLVIAMMFSGVFPDATTMAAVMAAFFFVLAVTGSVSRRIAWQRSTISTTRFFA